MHPTPRSTATCLNTPYIYIFKATVGMTEFADNFGKDKRFIRTNWLCRCGGKRESEDHVTKECPVYDDIRIEFEDLHDDTQLASFFNKMCWKEET